MAAGAGPVTQQAFQIGRVRKLRGLTETAMAFIETLLELPSCGIERQRAELARRALVAVDRLQGLQQGGVLVAYWLMLRRSRLLLAGSSCVAAADWMEKSDRDVLLWRFVVISLSPPQMLFLT